MLDHFTSNNLRELVWQLLDTACAWTLVYYYLKTVKSNSRTIQIFRGVLLMATICSAVSFLGLHAVVNLADSIMNWGAVATIIIPRPEIRSILKKIGKANVLSRTSTLTINERENLMDELIKACAGMSKAKIGTLISIEQGHSLGDYIKAGTPMNSVVFSELLCSIFQYGTPLHDGAAVIQGMKIACTAAYFPPMTREPPTSCGARHYAAVGISEIIGSITTVMSKETDNISIAEDDKLTMISEASPRELLMNVVCKQQSTAVHDNQEELAEQVSAPLPYDGKKPGVFTYYFKGENRRTKKKTAGRCYAKKKKNEEQGKKEKDVVVVEQGMDRLYIEDLTQKQDEKLDALFENTVTGSERKEESTAETDEPKPGERKATVREKPAAVIEEGSQRVTEETRPVKKTCHEKKAGPKREPPKEQTGKTIMMNMASDLLDDVIESEAIALRYVKADEDEETPEKAKGRRDP